MFNRFAGIFHAFGQLERFVRQAIKDRHEAEAVYRLFGEKHDSLPYLIRRVAEDETGDRVNRYVTLLCARQVLDRLGRDNGDFRSRYRPQFKRVYELLGRE